MTDKTPADGSRVEAIACIAVLALTMGFVVAFASWLGILYESAICMADCCIGVASGVTRDQWRWLWRALTGRVA